MRNTFFVAGVVFLLSWCTPQKLFAYSYAEVQDEMVLIFKNAVADAVEGKWSDVSQLAKKGIGLQEGHHFTGNYLASRFDTVIEKKDLALTAELFANLVYLSIQEKFYRNSSEKIKNYKEGRARLQLAFKSYRDVLDGNVRKKDQERGQEIVKQFEVALNSLGNPGLFGIGKKDPDPKKFNLAVEKINDLIIKAFPGFKKK